MIVGHTITGIKIDNLDFNNHISTIYKKASLKLPAFGKTISFYEQRQSKITRESLC